MAKERTALAHPVFALEHGLSESERQALASDVRASLTLRGPSDAYWLPWVIYATEVGYTYDGEEYWQTFEQMTPGWATSRSRPRDWLRDRFVRFHKSYQGLRPSGRWADWFSIIAWPIQHAILPGYLQYHLAKLLYDLRFGLTVSLLADPRTLGEYLHAESSGSIKRLQEFAEEHALIGTIATALLLSGNGLTNTFLLPGTLQRLITDLEREQRARNWLRVAQDQVRRASLRGLAPRSTSVARAQPQAPTITKKEVPEVEPRLLLVPIGDEWHVYLETPDLTTLTTQFPRFRSVLAESRCAIGNAGKWQSRGWLLHGPHRVPLSSWPQHGEQLLRLEKSDPTLDALFRADFLLRPGPTWLFKVGTDGIASEIRSLAVRAGQRYVIVQTTGSLPMELPARVTKVRCSGIKAAAIDLPEALDTRTTAYLDRLGLNVWQTVHIWPVGASPATWDGEGWAEWLVGDQPVVGITSDSPIQRIVIHLDGAAWLEIKEQHGPAFVALPRMEIGLHRLQVCVSNVGPNAAEQSGALEFLIRAPRARLDAYKALFRVEVDPERASLDDLWRGVVNVAVHGPSGRGVTARIELAATTGGPTIAHKSLPTLRMPITAAEFRHAFLEHCDGDPGLENYFDDAKECRIHFDAGELGVCTVRLEHERRPLRWHAQRTNHGFTIRLVNEGEDDDTTVVDRYPFELPDQPNTIPAANFATSVLTPPSGLFVARNLKAQMGIIAPPALVVKGLAGLGIHPQVRQRRPIPQDIEELVHTYARWATARVIHHPLSFSFRHRVLTAIDAAISDLIYKETKVLGGPITEAQVDRIRNSVAEVGIRTLLTTLRADVLSLRTSSRADCFARRLFPLLSYPTAIPSPAPSNGRLWIAEFALRLASAPDTLAPWAKDYLGKGLQYLLKHNSIVRAARYIVLSGDLAAGSKPLSAGPLHKGWEWF